MGKIEQNELCQATRQIQDILQRYNLELVVWPNIEHKDCIWAIHKGEKPWTGARVATLK